MAIDLNLTRIPNSEVSFTSIYYGHSTELGQLH